MKGCFIFSLGCGTMAVIGLVLVGMAVLFLMAASA